MTLRIGSLFTGYSGLDMGVMAVLGGTVAWHSEIDPAACRVLAHHYPDMPNLGDITQVDWSTVEPVDVLVGGFPCQDVSSAGLRAGLMPGTRSGLWAEFARAIDQLRPALVIIENVRGLLSATASHPAHGHVEPCPWCMGNTGTVPLRALGAVLGDLAEWGFDAEWTSVRAADVGAPHGRFRVFITAWPADSDGAGLERAEPARGCLVPARCSAADTNGHPLRQQPVAVTGRNAAAITELPIPAATDTEGNGWDERWPEPARIEWRSDVAVSGDAVANTKGCGQWSHITKSNDQSQLVCSEPGTGDRVSPRHSSERVSYMGGSAGMAWGPYATAIERWEQQLGQPAPSPTEPGRNGPRLSARAVEWMMGLPAGWVTDVPGISRNDALRILGNGVVPAQAAEAVRRLVGAA